MDKFVVNGGKKICGSVKIDKAKNALLPIISATIAVEGDCRLRSFPEYSDTRVMLQIIKSLGGRYTEQDGDVIINTDALKTGVFPDALFKEIRASVFMLGAVLARTGRVEAVLPGGCNIGLRPIDIHVDGLSKMGARFDFCGERFSATCKRLRGAKICLPFPSVGATENLIISATQAEGETLISNAAPEPEVSNLVAFLRACGAEIYGEGTSTVRIVGGRRLRGKEFLPMSDRIEVGTYLIATVLLGGELEIKGGFLQNIFAIINKIGDSACKIYSFNDKIYISARGRPKALARTVADIYPAFPTDLQPQLVAMLSVADGVSEVYDRVFPQRFGYALEMNKLGADIRFDGKCATVRGVKSLVGSNVCAEDLRGGAGLLLACLKAEGVSVLNGAHHLDRGYSRIENKLNSLGLSVKRE